MSVCVGVFGAGTVAELSCVCVCMCVRFELHACMREDGGAQLVGARGGPPGVKLLSNSSRQSKENSPIHAPIVVFLIPYSFLSSFLPGNFPSSCVLSHSLTPTFAEETFTESNLTLRDQKKKKKSLIRFRTSRDKLIETD